MLRGLGQHLARARAAGGLVLAVDAGDNHAGGLPDALAGDPAVADPAWALLAAVGTDVMTLGNHDFDAGLGPLLAHLRDHPAPPVVATNLPAGHPLVPVAPPVRTWTLADGGQIAVFGLLTDDQSAPEVAATDPVAALERHLRARAPGLRAAIVLSHRGHFEHARAAGHGPAAGYVDDTDLLTTLRAWQLPCPVLVVGSHSHLRLEQSGRVAYLQVGSGAAALGVATLDQAGPGFAVRQESWPADDPYLPDPGPAWATAAAQVRRDLGAAVAAWAPVPVPPGIPPTEHAHRQGAHGETATLNLLADLTATAAGDLADVVLLCHRTPGKRPLHGPLDLPAWYATFPYGDRAALLSIPAAAWPALLAAAARRRAWPVGFLAHRGFLHADARLRYTVQDAPATMDPAIITALTWQGRPWPQGWPDPVRVLTTTYVALGAGGWRQVFAEAGLPGLERSASVLPWTLRERWPDLLHATTTPARLDGRLTQGPNRHAGEIYHRGTESTEK